jgi:hypothetical protein
MIVTNPAANRDTAPDRYKFYIPGICFVLFLGEGTAEQHDAYALNSNLRSCMWMSPWRQDSLFQSAVNMVKTSEPIGSLRKFAEAKN